MRRLSLSALAAVTMGIMGGMGSFIPAMNTIRLQAALPPGAGPERKMVRTRAVRFTRLNRSRHWAFAETYREARAISPYPWKPVR